MTKEKRNHVLDDNVVISIDNIELLSRVIALSAIKKFKNYAYGVNKEICNLHKQLQYDIAYKKESEPFTDSYDLVQEASYFLCQNIGHKLGEFHSISRTKQRDSIRMSCFKHLFSYLRKERLHIVNTYEDNEILEYIETAIEQGIITDMTKNRLQELENEIATLDIEIQKEKYKDYSILTLDMIEEFLRKQIFKNADDIKIRKLLVNTFVREIRLFEDKVIILLNFIPPTDKPKLSLEENQETEKQIDFALSNPTSSCIYPYSAPKNIY